MKKRRADIEGDFEMSEKSEKNETDQKPKVLFISARATDHELRYRLKNDTAEQKLPEYNPENDNRYSNLRTRTIDDDIKAIHRSNAEFDIALNYAEAAQMFKKNSYDIVFCHRLKQGEVDAYTVIRHYFMKVAKENESKPVFVVGYQTLDDAIDHLGNMKGEMTDEFLDHVAKDYSVIASFNQFNPSGVLLSERKDLEFLSVLTGAIMKNKEHYLGKCSRIVKKAV